MASRSWMKKFTLSEYLSNKRDEHNQKYIKKNEKFTIFLLK